MDDGAADQAGLNPQHDNALDQPGQEMEREDNEPQVGANQVIPVDDSPAEPDEQPEDVNLEEQTFSEASEEDRVVQELEERAREARREARRRARFEEEFGDGQIALMERLPRRRRGRAGEAAAAAEGGAGAGGGVLEVRVGNQRARRGALAVGAGAVPAAAAAAAPRERRDGEWMVRQLEVLDDGGGGGAGYQIVHRVPPPRRLGADRQLFDEAEAQLRIDDYYRRAVELRRVLDQHRQARQRQEARAAQRQAVAAGQPAADAAVPAAVPAVDAAVAAVDPNAAVPEPAAAVRGNADADADDAASGELRRVLNEHREFARQRAAMRGEQEDPIGFRMRFLAEAGHMRAGRFARQVLEPPVAGEGENREQWTDAQWERFFTRNAQQREADDAMERQRGRKRGIKVTDEMIAEATEQRKKDGEMGDSQSIVYTRACPICMVQPSQRVGYTKCGHIACYPCAIDVSRRPESNGKCPCCRSSTGFIKLHEDEKKEVKEEENQ